VNVISHRIDRVVLPRVCDATLIRNERPRNQEQDTIVELHLAGQG
jgi:hypothetical protein